eukprot:TRINITY_DN2646_c1_g2_i1.p1 TRINITY_DN2646_c1_g2~~TRINITY_DN2646_c1_g2_i1.p1  ORF type:complete len:457 (+),score=78.03 TRINITY_DN2646_c1_g2_i1:146-1516(+)
MLEGATFEEQGRYIADKVLPLMMGEEEWAEKCNVAKKIQNLIRNEGHNRARVLLFGSSVSGLGEAGCDLDLACDLYGNGKIELLNNEVEIVAKVGRAFTRGESFSGLEVITGARCPIVKNTPPVSTQDRPAVDAKFDLSFRMNGVYNSRLLRKYFRTPETRTAAVFIKQWGKDVGVINPRVGFLSSYAVTLMFLHYAIRSRLIKYVYCDAYSEIDITEDLFPLEAPPKSGEARKSFHEKVGKLVRGFIKYFATEFDFKNHVVTIRTTSVVFKRGLGWKGPDGGISQYPNVHHYHLSIEDPYEQRGKYRVKPNPAGRNVSCGLRRPNYKLMLSMFTESAAALSGFDDDSDDEIPANKNTGGGKGSFRGAGRGKGKGAEVKGGKRNEPNQSKGDKNSSKGAKGNTANHTKGGKGTTNPIPPQRDPPPYPHRGGKGSAPQRGGRGGRGFGHAPSHFRNE